MRRARRTCRIASAAARRRSARDRSPAEALEAAAAHRRSRLPIALGSQGLVSSTPGYLPLAVPDELPDLGDARDRVSKLSVDDARGHPPGEPGPVPADAGLRQPVHERRLRERRAGAEESGERKQRDEAEEARPALLPAEAEQDRRHLDRYPGIEVAPSEQVGAAEAP